VSATEAKRDYGFLHRPIPRGRRRRLPADTEIIPYLRSLPLDLRKLAVASFGHAQQEAIDLHWPGWAHEGQHPPHDDWRTWVIMAGRGFGKTRAGAECAAIKWGLSLFSGGGRMPRVGRIVIPGLAHHVVHRGNRRQAIFFSDADRRAYLDMLADACALTATRCLAWCLMDNHVHLVLVPEGLDGLRATIARAHTRYAQRINRAQAASGHLFEGRYASYAMDDAHLMVAVRYIENNPVAAGLARRAEDWRWSSARAHVLGRNDGLTDIDALGHHVAN